MTAESTEPGECVDAGSGSCGGEVTFAPDPFAEEIWGNETPVWMCAEHRYASAQDI